LNRRRRSGASGLFRVRLERFSAQKCLQGDFNQLIVDRSGSNELGSDMLKDLNKSQIALAEYISELSEEAYYASWYEGVEYALWNSISDRQNIFGRLEITEEIKKRLRALSDSCGGWIYFDEKTEETFISISDWKIKFRENSKNFNLN
jgi:hypothetical protein